MQHKSLPRHPLRLDAAVDSNPTQLRHRTLLVIVPDDIQQIPSDLELELLLSNCCGNSDTAQAFQSGNSHVYYTDEGIRRKPAFDMLNEYSRMLTNGNFEHKQAWWFPSETDRKAFVQAWHFQQNGLRRTVLRGTLNCGDGVTSPPPGWEIRLPFDVGDEVRIFSMSSTRYKNNPPLQGTGDFVHELTVPVPNQEVRLGDGATNPDLVTASTDLFDGMVIIEELKPASAGDGPPYVAARVPAAPVALWSPTPLPNEPMSTTVEIRDDEGDQPGILGEFGRHGVDALQPSQIWPFEVLTQYIDSEDFDSPSSQLPNGPVPLSEKGRFGLAPRGDDYRLQNQLPRLSDVNPNASAWGIKTDSVDFNGDRLVNRRGDYNPNPPGALPDYDEQTTDAYALPVDIAQPTPASPDAQVYLAGYMNTELRVGQPGTVNLVVLAGNPGSISFRNDLTITIADAEIVPPLINDEGWYLFTLDGVVAPSPVTNGLVVLLDNYNYQDIVWPYLTVK